MRICLVYDCLYPWTVGGGERWCRQLAERLVVEGHEVDYLTLRQWEGEPPADLGFRVVPVGPRLALYGAKGQRRILPPLLFGLGVFWRLLTGGRRYDVVHTAAFPYFSLLAAGVLRPLLGFHLVVDWYEVWSRAYWRAYLGPVAGRIGWWVQALCLRIRQEAFTLAEVTAQRLRREGLNGEVEVLRGLYAGPLTGRDAAPAEPLVLFVGRHIPEKRPAAVVAAVALARKAIPELRARILGDGPERPAVLAAIAAAGLEDVIEAPGFVSAEAIQQDMARALCLLAPTSREGYGLVVVEAAAAATPTILVTGEDNAATDLVEPGVNGLIASTPSAEDLAAAIIAVHAAGTPLRQSTADWFARNVATLSMDASLARVVQRYGEG